MSIFKYLLIYLLLLSTGYLQAVCEPFVIAIEGGTYHSLALKSDGTVWTWGNNTYGQLGNGTNTDSNVPVQVNNLTDVIAIAAGGYHSLAVTSDGIVWAWGNNQIGQLGNGTTTNSNTPVQVNGLTNIISIGAGEYHSLALRSDGTVWSWGDNLFGQLGNGTTNSSNFPIQVEDLTDATTIAGGFYHSLALRSDGTVWAWGYNGAGQLGDGTYTSSDVPVEVSDLTDVIAIAGGGYFSIAVKSDGTVWDWGDNTYGQLGTGTTTSSNVPVAVVGGPNNFISVAAGFDHSLALSSDGTIWAWGNNSIGQLGNGTNTNSNVPIQVLISNGVAIAAGGNHSLAQKRSGTLWGWGDNSFGQLGNGTNTNSNVPVQTANALITGVVTAISGGGDHSLALRSNGTVWAWGDNSFGQLGNGTNINFDIPVLVSGLTNIVAISAGGAHSLALRSDGTVWAWGDNSNGQLGNGTTVNTNTPVQVSGLTNIVAISAGGLHSLALSSDGTVWAWGDNSNGQLGNGTHTDSNIPVQVAGGLTNVTAIAAGAYFSLALRDDGTVWAWGDNSYGQLGNGTNKSSNLPITVVGLPTITIIKAGYYHSLALGNDGIIRSWGRNNHGQLGNETNTDSNVPVNVTGGLANVIAIAGGGTHSLAIRNDNTAWAWGNNIEGELGNGTNLSTNSPTGVVSSPGVVFNNAMAIAGGASHSLALINGGVWTWGYNFYGQLGNGTTIDSNLPVEIIVLVSAIATPLNQTICTGQITSISLSSNVSGTTFVWKVIQNGVSGASAGTGSSIAQTLSITENAAGTATYIVTPVTPDGCFGPPIKVIINVEKCQVKKPTHFRSRLKLVRGEMIHILTWRPSPDKEVTGYKIFEGGQLITIIEGRKAQKIRLHGRKPNKTYRYKIVAFTETGLESKPAKFTVRKF